MDSPAEISMASLCRANALLLDELEAARMVLMDSLVERRREDPTSTHSLRAMQYALILVRNLETVCERRQVHYFRLLQDDEAELQLSELEILIVERCPEDDSSRPAWMRGLLGVVRSVTRRLVGAPRGLAELAFEVAQAFERRTAWCHAEWELERVRDDIVGEAGQRFDRLMAEALCAAWPDILRFVADHARAA